MLFASNFIWSGLVKSKFSYLVCSSNLIWDLIDALFISSAYSKIPKLWKVVVFKSPGKVAHKLVFPSFGMELSLVSEIALSFFDGGRAKTKIIITIDKTPAQIPNISQYFLSILYLYNN